MPLSPSTARSPVHTRTVTCNAFHRDDDLIDIEGHMTDVKSYEIPNRWRGPILPGQPIHDMWLRLTLDRMRKFIPSNATNRKIFSDDDLLELDEHALSAASVWVRVRDS